MQSITYLSGSIIRERQPKMNFINDNFLLSNHTAKVLYKSYAQQMPIVDYHTHLDPKAIAENHHFSNLAEVWLGTDHYKWRLMRANGIDEHYITGGASEKDKFEKWVKTLQKAYRNPLYHWAHMELSFFFGVDDLLTEENANSIYEHCTSLLQSGKLSIHELLKKSNVEVICTTDDPLDDLKYHRQIALSNLSCKVLPTWRADKVLKTDDLPEFNEYLNRLSLLTDIPILRYDQLIMALDSRHYFFHQNGCRLADHGLSTLVSDPYSGDEVNDIFQKMRSGIPPEKREQNIYLTAILTDLALLNHKRGWAQQYHLGPLRNNSSLLFENAGADIGTDSMGDDQQIPSMSHFFDRLDKQNSLSRTIVYNLNPKDSEAFASMAANFNQSPTAGKMQYGAAWWLLDHKSGIERQIDIVSSYGLLATSIGMLTDSRSFLSFVRHDYYRRILCNLLGHDIEAGLIPSQQFESVGRMIEDICHHNAIRYFNF